MVRNYKQEMPQEFRSTLKLFDSNWNVMRIFYLKWKIILYGHIDKSQTVSSAPIRNIANPYVFDTVIPQGPISQNEDVFCVLVGLQFLLQHFIILPSYSPAYHLKRYDIISSWLVLKLVPARSKLHFR